LEGSGRGLIWLTIPEYAWKVKTKLLRFLRTWLIKQHAMEEWWYSSTILNHGTRWRWEVSFRPRPLYQREESRCYTLYRGIGKYQRRPDAVEGEKSFIPAGNRNPIPQLSSPVSRLYIDWAEKRHENWVTIADMPVEAPTCQSRYHLRQMFDTSSISFTDNGNSIAAVIKLAGSRDSSVSIGTSVRFSAGAKFSPIHSS
jgi:hypothetical protein